MGEEQGVKVKTIFDVLDHASHKFHKLAENAEKLERHAERAKAAVEGVLAPKLAAVGLALGFGEMAVKMYEASEAAEEMERALTGAYLMSGRFSKLDPGAEMAISLEKAESAYDDLEKMAMKGVASTRTYVTTFQALSPIMAKTHAQTAQMEEVAGELVARFKAIGMPAEMAAEATRNMANAITTGAGRPSKELLKLTHMSVKEWQHLQKLGPEKLWEGVYRNIQKTKKPLDSLFHGPGIAMERLRNTAEHFMRVLGTPVLEELGKQAQKLVDWLQKNQDQAKEIAKAFTGKVVAGLQMAIRATEVLAKHWKLILGGLTLIMGAPTAIGAAVTASKLAGSLASVAARAAQFAGSLMNLSGPVAMGLEVALKGLGAAAGIAGAAFIGFKFGEWLAEKYGDQISRALGDKSPELEKKVLDTEEQALKLAKQRRDLVRARKGWASIADQNKKAMAQKEKTERPGEEWAKGWKPEKVENNFDFRGSRFDIKQQFAAGFDPDRVAVAFTHDLAKVGEFRGTSGQSPAYSRR